MKYTFTTQEDFGQLWTTTLSSREYKKKNTSKSFKKRNKKWTGWKPTTEDQSMHFKKEVTKNAGNKEENLSTVQKNIENAARKIRHRTKAQREKEIMNTPETVRLREEAAARCTAKIQQRTLRKQARKARAEHLAKCSLEPGKKKAKRKPLTELYVKGHFTEDRAEWQEKLHRHCDAVYTDVEETNEVQEKRIELFPGAREPAIHGGRT